MTADAQEHRATARASTPAPHLAPPALPPAFVCRERLLDLLDAAVAHRLTLVSAPAGAGKTALLSAWAATERPPGPVGWLTLDEADADPRRFWRGVLAALVGAGALTRDLAVPPRGRARAVLPALAAALAERDAPVVLVIDDLHVVRTGDAPADGSDPPGGSWGVAGDVEALVARTPATLRVVVATRADPPWRLGRLRLAGTVAEIREADLAATRREAAEVFARHDLDLRGDDVARMWRRTEGWMAGLGLAALSLAAHPDPSRFVADFAGGDRAVSDYLLTEVLARQPPDLRELLLATSVVGRVDAELAAALTGRPDADALLADLDRRNTFVGWLDDGSARYHPLFAEFLRVQLWRETPERVPELHRVAARVLARRGRDVEALRHAAAAGDWALVADLVAARWPALLLAGDADAAHALCRDVPRAVLEDRPAAAVACAVLETVGGRHAAADEAVAIARAAPAAAITAAEPRFSLALAVVDLYQARLRGDVAVARRAALALTRAHGVGWDAVVAEADLRLLASTSLGVTQVWTGDPAAGEEHLERGLALARHGGRDYQALSCTAHLAVADTITGRLPRSAARAEEAVRLAAARGWEATAPVVAAKAVLGGARFHWNDLDGAAAVLAEADPYVADAPEPVVRALHAVNTARVLGGLGRVDDGLARLWAVADELGDWPAFTALRHLCTAEEARLLAARGDADVARSRLEAVHARSPNTQVATALARLALAAGDPAGAVALLAPHRAPRADGVVLSTTVEANVVAAVAHASGRDQAAALDAIERALALAEAAGYRRPFVATGDAVRVLLEARQRHGTAHQSLLDTLLDDFRAAAGGDGHGPQIVEPLSPRELVVLRHLPTMRSSVEIAAALYVSPNTLKTHLKSIYRKLSATGRRDAVQRARKLGLLGPAGRDAP